MFDSSLFPTSEEWGTGDEAMDNRLSIALKKTLQDLSTQSITDFYFLGLSQKPRAYNPSFMVTIELVTKALIHAYDPYEKIDLAMKKIKGAYQSKEKMTFDFSEKLKVISELKLLKKYRFKDQIDFSINLQNPFERNPYTRAELSRSSIDLSTKIIFKEFKNFLNGDSKAELLTEPLFSELRGGTKILFIEDFAELWYHQDQIFTLSLMS